jgi:hypothetical protein
MPDKNEMELPELFNLIMEVIPEEEDIADWPEKAKRFANVITGIFMGLSAGIAIN